MSFEKRLVDYRDALATMRKVTPSGEPVPFSLSWFEGVENEGKFRSEHNLVLCGQKRDMRTKYVDVRYKDGAHHDTRILITHLYAINEQHIHL